MPPDLRDLGDIQAQIGLGLHDLEAFGIRLHQAVFDAVVHHLDEVARAIRADMSPTPISGGREGLEDRAQTFDRFGLAAHHQAVTLLQAPDAAARPDIDKMQAAGFDDGGVANGVLVVAVAAVDDDVARVEQFRSTAATVFSVRFARRDHNPGSARRIASLLTRSATVRVATAPAAAAAAIGSGVRL